ncbi:uncharacterized protein M421DRAFT_420469 [Didymella exigua CBS 183.55]|uniref:Uncharacterized protein n=1 Tax=Didymella exigua CBS 183.55 TaxID=1150837 RepID=A0A6A5RMR7_9PLEO|nr:uncharacterized protein M421DRAFT_420469 [Didymella exigua CBS 183.55]KAF1928580.1 hypothetical protein M421DRAFT_420469 [Didymella exigua CBS 183.55]
MRVTRAAQRAQEDMEEDVAAPEVSERALKDIEPNATPAAPTEEPLSAKTPAKTPAKKGRGKGKKGAKGKKAKSEGEAVQVVGEAERQAAASPIINEAAGQEPAQEHTDDTTPAHNGDEQPDVPQTPAVRLTRRQQAKLEEEEAPGKSHRVLSPQPEERNEDVAGEGVEQAEVDLKVEADAAPVENKTLAAHEEHAEVEPQTARKPTRRTRRQQVKIEKEQPEKTIAQDATEQSGASEVSEAPEAPVEAANIVVENGTPAVMEQIKKVEHELTPKPVRLTRRQQAKLDEEQKQAQVEQQTPQPGPTEEEVLEEIVDEAQAEAQAAAQQKHMVSGKPAHGEIDKMEDVAPAVATEPLGTQEEGVTEPQDESVQIGVQAVEEKMTSEVQAVEAEAAEAFGVEEIIHEARPATSTADDFETDFNMQVDSVVPEEAIPSVEIVPEAEPKMLHAEKPFEGTVSTPTKNQGSIRRTSRSLSRSPMRLEESISAIDRLEEDLESIGKVIPDLDHSDEEHSPKKSPSQSVSAASTTRKKTSAKASARTPAKVEIMKPGMIPAKAPIPTRAPVAARASIAPKKAVTVKPVLPTRISRVPSAAPKSVESTMTSLARASSVCTVPGKDIGKPLIETADYLASKRRPISLSFPTPPPPPKGRAPTKPTFQLSSDNVAAKLRAQREERLKREAEGTAAPKQRPISMPPPPKSTKPTTIPSFQLPGEATAAKLKVQKEERLKRMEEAGGVGKPASRPISMPPPPKSTKQLTKPSFQLPGEATAIRLKAKKEERLRRMEEAEAAKKAAAAAAVRKHIAHRPRDSLLVRDAPGISILPPPQSDAPQRSTSLASKRSSIIDVSASRSTSTSSANRNSVLLAEGGKSTVTPLDAAALKVKGKHVFNRDRMEKEALERERREKEEAAKRARAEAAERGRIASREWAEKQRKKVIGQ